MKRILLVAAATLSVLSLAARQPSRGYRGFADWSNSITRETIWSYTDGTNHVTVKDNLFFTGFSTSHGYQFSPNFYLGAGLGIEKNSKYDEWIGPVFIDVRTDQEFGKFTPFADLRIGMCGGIYLSPSVGYRFNWGRKVGINIAAGYTLRGYKVDVYDFENPVQDDLGYWTVTYLGRETRTHSYFSFRVGIDF